MKITKGLIAVTVAVVLMTGCAPRMQLVKDVSPEQLAKDNAECNLEAMKAVIGLSQSILLEVERNKAITYCLQAKGYAYRQPQTEPSEATDRQKAVHARYGQAFNKAKIKNDAISEHIVSVCRPQDDKGYIECINANESELISNAVFPDIVRKMLKEDEEFKQQLLRKEITRKEFKEYSTKAGEPFFKQIGDRADKDVKAGIYTGNPMY